MEYWTAVGSIHVSRAGRGRTQTLETGRGSINRSLMRAGTYIHVILTNTPDISKQGRGPVF